MDQRVESQRRRERLVGDVQRAHVSRDEVDLRVQAARFVNHARGNIDARDPDAPVVQVSRNMPGAAPEIADSPATPHLPSDAPVSS